MSRDRESTVDLAGWLSRTGLCVFYERKLGDQPDGRIFSVKGTGRGRRPDLLVYGDMVAGGRCHPGCYVAVEVKPGSRHQDILDGFDAVLSYFTDFALGANYEVGGSSVDVSAIVLMTAFGPRGYLFKEEGKFDPKGIVKGPWDAYPMAFTVARLLWRQRDNITKRLRDFLLVPGSVGGSGRSSHWRLGQPLPEVGIMVSDPRMPGQVLLMLSAHPYHWHVRAAAL